MIRALKTFRKRFRSSDEGSLAVEMLLMMPLLVWAVVATVVYFDGYRSRFLVQKSGTTIADFVSRELAAVDAGYVDGLADLFEVLAPSVTDHGLRVSLITFEEITAKHFVLWSENRGTHSAALNDSDLVTMAARLPLMGEADRYIIVETRANYDNPTASLFGPILTNISLGDTVAIIPRLADTICFETPASQPDIC